MNEPFDNDCGEKSKHHAPLDHVPSPQRRLDISTDRRSWPAGLTGTSLNAA